MGLYKSLSSKILVSLKHTASLVSFTLNTTVTFDSQTLVPADRFVCFAKNTTTASIFVSQGSNLAPKAPLMQTFNYCAVFTAVSFFWFKKYPLTFLVGGFQGSITYIYDDSYRFTNVSIRHRIVADPTTATCDEQPNDQFFNVIAYKQVTAGKHYVVFPQGRPIRVTTSITTPSQHRPLSSPPNDRSSSMMSRIRE